MSEQHPFYAHSKPGCPVSEWQPLDQHLQNVAEKAKEFAEPFGSGEWGHHAGLLHDLGKAASEFQSYLKHANGLDDEDYDGIRINHSSAGAAYAEDVLKGVSGRTLAYLIAGHHAGLPDWFSERTGNAALQIRLEEGRENLARIRERTAALVCNVSPTQKPPGINPSNYHLWVRMLYSCLADADFLDTESFMQAEQAAERGRFSAIRELKARFDRHMEELAGKASDTLVNRTRQAVLRACREKGSRESGLYSLTVPTGGGKTLSGMAFALEHALMHGKARIIYVIPYTSIIEQTASILRGIFGDGNVVEHHSNLDPERETQRSRLAAENWDAPVVVTTNVQFFESLYAAKSSRCRKLHNIVNSVVLLDEAQLIPPQWLTPCVHVIGALTGSYGVTMVLSTATQPSLPGLEPVEIVENPAALYEQLKRVEYELPSDMASVSEWEDIAGALQKYDQVLCVVNSRRDCHELHRLMPEGTIHLSALMCGQHRSEKIAAIKHWLTEGKQVRVISTQLVESGVDIDFPVVYRALGGLDSIAQAAGRCNREGKQGRGKVVVFLPPKDPPRGLLAKAAGTTRELATMGRFQPDDPGSYKQYFELFYSRANDTGVDFLNGLQKDGSNVPFRSAGQDFKLIDDTAQRPVIVRYGDSGQWIDRLRFAGPTREIMRRLQRYVVNLPARMVDEMLADGRLQIADKSKAPDIIVQACVRYDESTGLDVYSGQVPVEDLIV